MVADTESEIGFAQLGLGSVLKHHQLTVPANQREYAWEVKEVTTLFRDIAREIGEGRRSYFSAEPLKLVQQPLQCRHGLREHQRVH